MHLELRSPPALIGVVTDDGAVRPALLLAVRGERRFVQVSHGPGANCLRWVDAAQVRPVADPAAARSVVGAPARDGRCAVTVRPHRTVTATPPS